MLRIRADSHSDKGDRSDNEDRAVVLRDGRVCALADGVGGQRGGEVASCLAMETAEQWVGDGRLGEGDESPPIQLLQLFQGANQRILDRAREEYQLADMGTTLTVALIGERLHFAHIGDSRLYLWRGDSCRLLTEDHTTAQEMVCQGWLTVEAASRSRYRHILSRCLGTVRTVEPQVGAEELRGGDRLLLCSDGLYDTVTADNLERMLGREQSPGEIAHSLVDAARRGRTSGLDNVTALVILLD
jgi:PPM family protein phosphatase